MNLGVGIDPLQQSQATDRPTDHHRHTGAKLITATQAVFYAWILFFQAVDDLAYIAAKDFDHVPTADQRTDHRGNVYVCHHGCAVSAVRILSIWANNRGGDMGNRVMRTPTAS